jgi:hypothetical protein
MDKLSTVALFALLVVIGIGLFTVFDGFFGNPVVTVDKVEFVYSAMSANTTQGGSVSINCSIINLSQERSVKEGMSIQLIAINNKSDYQAVWYTFFNQTFTPNPVLIEPQGQGTTVLTIKLADDAPVGTYHFAFQGVRRPFELIVTQKTAN